ncbi:hypothetical protein CRI94_02425 [Longibacter salinarum]|uniref:Phage holin family protein n=1 Tax=Longibacter salinarum TaxID=1850348 RepID=A0A2A8D2J3_9BACT|nr:phage holin family protein [Longibacter salinarum]PEN15159.1 hypothetical protein CRI94_02425 [Longibacter salinarum]
MASLPDRPGTEHPAQTPSRRGGKLQRMTDDTKGIVTDLREWIDLRLDLAVREINDKVDDAASQAALGVVLAILAFFTGLFGLTTIALGLGWWLGRPFWGFLIVSGLLSLVAFIVATVAKRHPIVVETPLFQKIRGDRYQSDDESTDSASDDTPSPESATSQAKTSQATPSADL